MKHSIVLFSLLISTGTFALHIQEMSQDRQLKIVNDITEQDSAALERFRKLPRLERARLFHLFQRNQKENWVQAYISKDDALTALTRTLKTPQDNPNSFDLYHAGLIYAYDNDYDNAMKCFRVSSEPESYYMQAKLILDRATDIADFKKAQELLEKSEQLGYGKATIGLEKMRIHLANNATIEATADSAEKQQEITPSDAIVQFLSKPINNTTIRRFIKTIGNNISEKDIARIIGEPLVHTSPHFIFFAGKLLEHVLNLQLHDNEPVCVLLDSVRDVVKIVASDESKKNIMEAHKETFITLFNSDVWKKLELIAKEDKEVGLSVARLLETIGFYYNLPTAVERCLDLYCPDEINQTVTVSINHLHFLTALLYAKAAEYDKALLWHEKAAQREPRYLWDLFYFINKYINDIPSIEKQVLLEKAINAMTSYVDLVSDVPCDHLMYIFNSMVHGIDIRSSTARVQADYTRAMLYGKRLLDQLNHMITQDSVAQDPKELEKIKEYRVDCALGLIRSVSALDSDMHLCAPLIDMLRSEKPSSLLNVGIIFYNYTYIDKAQEAFREYLAIPHTNKSQEDLARFYLGLISLARNSFEEALTIFSQVELLEICKITPDQNVLMEKFISFLKSRVEYILSKEAASLIKDDLLTCRVFGKIILSKKDESQVLDKIGLAIKSLCFAARHGDINSQIALWMCTNKTSPQIWSDQFTKMLDMLKKFAKKEFPLFANDSQAEISSFIEKIATYLLQLQAEPHAMITYIAPLYADNYEDLLGLIKRLNVETIFTSAECDHFVMSEELSNFINFLKKYCSDQIASIKTLDQESIELLQQALLLEWNLFLAEHPTIRYQQHYSYKQKIKDLYKECCDWKNRIPFTKTMTRFHEYMTLQYCIETENEKSVNQIPLLESLVTTSDSAIHSMCSMILLCRRHEKTLQQQAIRLLCNYMAVTDVKDLPSKSAMLQGEYYHLISEMKKRGELEQLKIMLSCTAPTDCQSPRAPEKQLLDLITQQLKKKKTHSKKFLLQSSDIMHLLFTLAISRAHKDTLKLS